mmetsp:Transcript_59599/g.94628  ORF Transcript_59599/g.94628 Transcript_59599/m.94628 type:complete len:241 (-) Transcript_59599:1432-2154(-)
MNQYLKVVLRSLLVGLLSVSVFWSLLTCPLVSRKVSRIPRMPRIIATMSCFVSLLRSFIIPEISSPMSMHPLPSESSTSNNSIRSDIFTSRSSIAPETKGSSIATKNLARVISESIFTSQTVDLQLSRPSTEANRIVGFRINCITALNQPVHVAGTLGIDVSAISSSLGNFQSLSRLAANLKTKLRNNSTTLLCSCSLDDNCLCFADSITVSTITAVTMLKIPNVINITMSEYGSTNLYP